MYCRCFITISCFFRPILLTYRLPHHDLDHGYRFPLILPLLTGFKAATCIAGRYCSSENWFGVNFCTNCPQGYSCPAQTSSSSACWGNDNQASDSAPKLPCGEGAFAEASAAVCTEYWVGYYSAVKMSSQCR